MPPPLPVLFSGRTAPPFTSLITRGPSFSTKEALLGVKRRMVILSGVCAAGRDNETIGLVTLCEVGRTFLAINLRSWG